MSTKTLGNRDTTFLYEDLRSKVRGMGTKCLEFSIFDDDGGDPTSDWMVMAPNIESAAPAIEGRWRIMIDYWRIAGEPVLSQVLENPTWAQLILETDKLLQKGDGFGVFLENFYITQHNGEHILEAAIGS